MLFFLDLADKLLVVLHSVGDFFFTKKAFISSNLASVITGVTDFFGLSFISDFFNSLSSPSFCFIELIIGPLLIYLLQLKIVKFILSFYGS